ncbi:EthD domain-containing protein [Nitrospirillum sp. BR 11828]|uniref:EthD domain-containing protein n=1 Tax=Nitrospirillum sp. BR 11828 TaxID=3104325 RepID=UPI002ACA3736|nr:EthD domain-containing protein [Nitrospirillum sp. BR 11828]MDZ5645962.1 EthD domain-containing protein [Nitrospirillum sp. BR 11828]
MIAGRPCLTKSRDQALTHLRTVHGPMVFAPPADAGAMPSRYEQNHVFYPQADSSGRWLSDRDFVTEVWFNDFGHLAASVSTPYYLSRLRPDEDNFVDQDTVLKCVVREEGKWGVTKPDAAKLFIFLKRSPSANVAAFEAAWTSAMNDLQTRCHPIAGLVNVALPGPGGAEPYADYALEFWFADQASALSAVENPVLPTLERLSPVLDTPRSFFLLADAYPVERLRQANGL